MVMPRKPLAEMFWSRVQLTSDCWLWTGQKTTTGYGHLAFNRPPKRYNLKAHRISWELHYGQIPDGLFVCHHCDTPLCVRPDHLFLGTAGDNTRDGIKKGRYAGADHGKFNRSKTHCPHGHPYDAKNTRLRIRKEGQRRDCRECDRVRAILIRARERSR